MSDALPFSAAALLEAIEGVAYAVGGDGTIMGFSRGPYLWVDNRTPWKPQEAVGRNIFGMLNGDAVTSAYRALHDAVWHGGLPSYGFEYRCDEPAVERRMRMSLSRVTERGRAVAVLYQSVMVHEVRRTPIPLFGADLLVAVRADPSRPSVVICSYCHAVAWPGHADPGHEDTAHEKEWVEAPEYYRRGGEAEVQVSHGICPPCYVRVVEPAIDALRDRRAN